MSRIPDVPQSFLVPAGRLQPNWSIERDFELFDEFALFAIDKWYQLPTHSSVNEEDPEGVPAFGAVEWSLAPLRVDVEAGEGFVLASSPCGVDSGKSGVYSSSYCCSRVSPATVR
jgi:hypothetical protein